MVGQYAIQDENRFPALLGHSGTSNAATPIRIVVNADGSFNIGTVSSAGTTTISSGTVIALPSLITQNYDYVAVTYPAGTTEVYSFKIGGSGGTSVGTVTVNYLDSAKGSVSTVTKT